MGIDIGTTICFDNKREVELVQLSKHGSASISSPPNNCTNYFLKYFIVVRVFPRYLNSEDYEGGLDRSVVEDILSNIESNFQTWCLSFSAVAMGVNDPLSIDKFGKSLQKMRPDIALLVGKNIFLGDHRDVLEKVEVPCTIIQTTNDVVVPISVSHYMKSKIKGKTSIEIIEADGHFPQLTAHQLLIDALDRVLGFDSD
ncbi:strigolactone esterase D14-like [Tasmannia lanceolata]|uniref:strigolactone esterase D14-like n=1 Tax=Tasmannia lanceolata TaxID=3420 RepID=UPI0040649EC9